MVKLEWWPLTDLSFVIRMPVLFFRIRSVGCIFNNCRVDCLLNDDESRHSSTMDTNLLLISLLNADRCWCCLFAENLRNYIIADDERDENVFRSHELIFRLLWENFQCKKEVKQSTQTNTHDKKQTDVNDFNEQFYGIPTQKRRALENNWIAHIDTPLRCIRAAKHHTQLKLTFNPYTRSICDFNWRDKLLRLF